MKKINQIRVLIVYAMLNLLLGAQPVFAQSELLKCDDGTDCGAGDRYESCRAENCSDPAHSEEPAYTICMIPCELNFEADLFICFYTHCQYDCTDVQQGDCVTICNFYPGNQAEKAACIVMCELCQQ